MVLVMNLWDYFPDFIVMFSGALLLPFVALLFYLYVVYIIFNKSTERLYLIIFILLTLVSSSIMVENLGHHVGKIVAPLSLILVMMMPIFILMINLYKRSYIAMRLWFIVTIAGFFHGMSWWVILFTIANS